MRRRSARPFFFLFFLLAAANVFPRAAAAAPPEAGEWLSVRSQNFLVVGQAREKDLRRAATRLEQYRAVFARLLSNEHFDLSVPTAVIIFRDGEAFAPFRPVFGGQASAGVAGFFQPGTEINYIALSLDSEADGSSSTLLHEYVHLLINNYFRNAPLWLKEGVSEFYSTLRLSGDGRSVTLGAPPRQRTLALRGRALLPLRTLLDVDQQSPHFLEPDSRRLFYAQTWAFVHYLVNGRGVDGRAQLARYLELLASGATPEDGFREAFGATVDDLEEGFAAYARRSSYAERVEKFSDAPDFDAELRARPLTKAEALAQLGDLLVRCERGDAAERYLQEAVGLDAGFAPAHVSLGVLRLRQNRVAEALAHLRRAVEADPRSHLARYHLAEALNREGLGMSQTDASVSGFDEKTELLRAELRRAIELAPNFVEPYRLLAAVELDRAGRADEAEALLSRALSLAPRRREFTLLLAQVRLSRGEFDAARRLAEEVEMRCGEPQLREQARKLLASIALREDAAARLKAREEEAMRLEESAVVASQPCDMPARGPQHKRLRFAGEQACGRLVQVECADAGIVFHVATDERTLRFRADTFNRVRLITYTTAVQTGQFTCGPREPSNPVLITFMTKKGDKSGFDGEAVAVEFIPQGWNQ